MSSLRNVVKRREHKERGQLRERKKLGLLEKHKDYVKRARDYNKKQDHLKALAVKAAFRNPDEFYFRMNSTRTEDGVHVSTHNHHKQLSAEALKVLKTQDLAYLHMKRAVDLRKAEKLNEGLHFIDAAGKDNKHVVFVDSKDEVESFDVAKHFDTVPEIADRAFNRLRKDTLKTVSLPAVQDKKTLKKLGIERDAVYRELNDRLQRASTIDRMRAKLDLERKVQAKGKKMKIKDAEDGQPAVYRWKKQRQK
uniref:U3 small nucleolar RNA-associated protein 11 n=1 Tax=Globisporangium ultimum (strain ATCC 200006 / CBS 805.95 / DAOM BR144) TaxID=431595 RepID=K3WAT9_GLOUD